MARLNRRYPVSRDREMTGRIRNCVFPPQAPTRIHVSDMDQQHASVGYLSEPGRTYPPSHWFVPIFRETMGNGEPHPLDHRISERGAKMEWQELSSWRRIATSMATVQTHL